jgi:protein phosphatase PTC1
MSQYLLDSLRGSPTKHIPDILNETFHNVDQRLSRMCEESDGKIHSGCTAVTAFLRVEDADGGQSFLSGIMDPLPVLESPAMMAEGNDDRSSPESGSESQGTGSGEEGLRKKKAKKPSGASRFKNAFKSLSSASVVAAISPTQRSSSPSLSAEGDKFKSKGVTVVVPPQSSRRVLYSANAGDARGVLCRGGKAVRLTYDHKGSDKQEAKRITDAGGFVMSGRVNGVLAVTRSLGDSSMKEFVVGAPYTTETELCEDDEFLVLACDGVFFSRFNEQH